MPVQPVKFIKSLYYANRPFQQKQRVIVDSAVPKQIYENISPYMHGFEQLAKKYKLKIEINPLGNKGCAVTNIKDKSLFIEPDASGADIAEAIYKTVSGLIKK